MDTSLQCYLPTKSRGVSRISEKGGLLVNNFTSRGGGGGKGCTPWTKLLPLRLLGLG